MHLEVEHLRQVLEGVLVSSLDAVEHLAKTGESCFQVPWWTSPRVVGFTLLSLLYMSG